MPHLTIPVFFRGCPVYKFESEVAALRFKEARQLLLLPADSSLSASQLKPHRPRLTLDSPPTTSHPSSSTHTAFSSTPLVPSSSTIISSTCLTHHLVTSVPVNNNFSLLNSYPNLYSFNFKPYPPSTLYSSAKHQTSLLCFSSKTIY